MPELPEVETSRRGITPWLTEQIILRTEIRNTQLRWPIDEKIITLRHQKVISVQRRAKYLLLQLKNGWIIIHFGMSGKLRVLLKSQLPEKHDHVDLVINNGCIIRYTDPRRFGAWLWIDKLYKSKLLQYQGIEPFSSRFNGHWLYQKSRNINTLIKPWLMNNKTVVGIGNIYANESLFIANILPGRTASTLSEKESWVLSNSIKTVLTKSIEYGGTTLQDFLQVNGKPGNFINKLQVYGREHKPCLVCGTLIKNVQYNQRSSFFCPTCQY